MGKKKSLGQANDAYAGFEDELTLAELIQTAKAHGIKHSVRGALFGQQKKYATEFEDEITGGKYMLDCGLNTSDAANKPGSFEKKPKHADCACVIGAQLLAPAPTKPLSVDAMHGNDREDDRVTESYFAIERSFQIGAAYEQAMRK